VIPDVRFLQLGHRFWANVRAISEGIGYTVRGKSAIRVPSLEEMRKALGLLGLSDRHIVDAGGAPTELGETLEAYFEYRARRLNSFVQPRLMDAERARDVFEQLRMQHKPMCPLPLNKQKGEKKAPAYLTGIVNILVEANAEGLPCVHDPRRLTTVTRDQQPLRTLARRVDGAFPSTVNPIAVWEVKEYYYTTTFGSRVADGVYESLLDGLELEELRETEGINVLHYLMVDAHYTWWICGKSYLCRIVDMLHMGYINEVLFGYEVVERLPSLVKEWVAISRQRKIT
jgi:hypothetical protein